MSEQRPRLLPFRLRRERGRRDAARLFRADDTPADAELRGLLGAWPAPPPDPAAGARLLAAFRAHAATPPRWRRVLSARVSVPVPLAAGAAAALVVSALALLALASRAAESPAVAAAAAAAAVRVVEAPVPQERVVTRVVYVERGPRAPAPRRDAPTPARPAPPPAVAETADAASYITGVDMAEFHPADRMKIRVIKKGRPDEEAAKPDATPERKTR
jgi:hypothetical protein